MAKKVYTNKPPQKRRSRFSPAFQQKKDIYRQNAIKKEFPVSSGERHRLSQPLVPEGAKQEIASLHSPGAMKSNINNKKEGWVRRNQLMTAKPMTGGMGMHLLQKMGWRPGEGLGPEKNGSLQPLLLEVKVGRQGLVSKEESAYKHPKANTKKQAPNSKKLKPNTGAKVQQALEEKHPVSLLFELASKRKWPPPVYTIVSRTGPTHSLEFVFSVTLNGRVYTPVQVCSTKKEARLLAARFCLQEIGIRS